MTPQSIDDGFDEAKIRPYIGPDPQKRNRDLLKSIREMHNAPYYLGEHSINRGLETKPYPLVYDIIDTRMEEMSGKQSILLVGVGRGSAAIDLMLRYGDDVDIVCTGLQGERKILHTPETLRKKYGKMTEDESMRYCKMLQETFKEASLEDINMVLDKRKFDVVVITRGVMQYVKDPIAAINKVKRMLHPGGEGVTELNSVAIEGEDKLPTDRAMSDGVMGYLTKVGHGFITLDNHSLYFRNVDDFLLPLTMIGQTVLEPRDYRIYQLKQP
ncbi:MAG: methyltransferase domain-containing protein [Candidatus Altiarchaeota archaeon]